jgi:DUF438 domain-containing protein
MKKTEDLHATGKIETTIEDIDMHADDWVEQAADKVDAVEGDTYVKLDRGVLTVEQINSLLNSMPFEITYADSNNQFLYYNKHIPREEMLAKRHPSQVGNPLATCHPEEARKNVAYVVEQLRAGNMDTFRVNVPTHGPEKYVVHSYKGIRDEDGNYMGINEYVQDLQPVIEWYLEQTGQELVGKKNTDAVSGATAAVDTSKDLPSTPESGKADPVDGVSSATKKD